jgi:hypothetical protein
MCSSPFPRFAIPSCTVFTQLFLLAAFHKCLLTHLSVLPPEMGVEVPDSRIFPVNLIVLLNDRKVRGQIGLTHTPDPCKPGGVSRSVREQTPHGLSELFAG